MKKWIPIILGLSTLIMVNQSIDFFEYASYETEQGPQAIEIAYLNDTLEDVLLVGNYDAGTLTIYSESQLIMTLDTGPRPRHIDVADMDNNGLPDILTVNIGDDTITIFYQVSSSPLLFETHIIPTGDAPHDFSLSDLNADGNLDIVTADTDTPQISKFLSNGTRGKFTQKTIPLDTAPRHIALTDVDQDGDEDIVLSNRDADSISVLLQKSPLNFTSPIHTKVGRGPRHFDVVDLNRDSYPDIAVVNTQSSTVSILRNTKNKEKLFQVVETISIDAWYYDVNLNYSTSDFTYEIHHGTKPFDIEVIDTDGNSKLEFYVTTQLPGSIRLFEQRHPRSFNVVPLHAHKTEAPLRELVVKMQGSEGYLYATSREANRVERLRL